MKRKDLMKVLLGAGLYLLDPIRDRVSGGVGDLSERAQDKYEAAANRMSRVARTIRGTEHDTLNNVLLVLLGVGVGVGIGRLLVPASGEEIRGNLADKVHDFGGRVKDRFAEARENTGTYGGV